MANPTVIKLQDGNVMPQLGLGVWQASNEEVITAIQKALEVGYRSIDTAAAYKNEEGVGKALKNASVNREELFITLDKIREISCGNRLEIEFHAVISLN